MGQCAIPVLRGREVGNVVGGEVDAVRAPHVRAEPAEVGQVLDGRAAVELQAVRALLHRLGQVRVQREAEAPRERRRLLHEPLRDRERGARRDGDLDAGSGPRLVERADEPLGVCEHGVELLHELVGREAAVRDAEVHRAAGRDDADAELARRLHLRLDQALLPAREDVVVVEHGRAAGERELGQSGARGGVLGLGVDPRPHRVELPQPAEEVRLLRPRAGEGLVQVVVRVDEPGRHDGAAELLAGVGLRLRAISDRRYETVLDQHPAVLVLGPRVVAGDDPAA